MKYDYTSRGEIGMYQVKMLQYPPPLTTRGMLAPPGTVFIGHHSQGGKGQGLQMRKTKFTDFSTSISASEPLSQPSNSAGNILADSQTFLSLSVSSLGLDPGTDSCIFRQDSPQGPLHFPPTGLARENINIHNVILLWNLKLLPVVPVTPAGNSEKSQLH